MTASVRLATFRDPILRTSRPAIPDVFIEHRRYNTLKDGTTALRLSSLDFSSSPYEIRRGNDQTVDALYNHAIDADGNAVFREPLSEKP